MSVDPVLRARNFRWLFANLLGHSFDAIAAAEVEPVNPTTVLRGVAVARDQAIAILGRLPSTEALQFDFAGPTGPSKSRRKCRPARSDLSA
jgi:hypothetical protein